MPRSKASRIQLEERIERAEEMLCAGLSPGRVEHQLSKDYEITTRQARKYMAKVYERWRAQNTADAPHRREKVLRMAERFYAKTLIDKKYTAAANALNLLAKLSGAFSQEPQRENIIAAIGPVPSDPTEALLYAQKAMVFALSEVISNPALDPERRLRWISEIGGKIGMTHAKALVQHRLAVIAGRVLPEPSVNDEGESIDPGQWDRFRNAGPGDAGAEPVPGHGSGSPTSVDEGVAAEGGRPVGSTKPPIH